MESLLKPQSGRMDRHVRRSHLRLEAETSRHRISFSLEEALRLAHLPGEEEGRVYCFRRVVLKGIEADANRRVWIQAVGRTMDELATQALHGAHPSAGASNAIYFNNREEALELLLGNAVKEVEAGTQTTPEWFSTSLLGLPAGTGYEKQIHVIANELQHSTNPAAGASIFFTALGERSPARLIAAIPEEVLRAWVRRLDSGAGLNDVSLIAIPNRLRAALQRAGTECGWAAPGTVWLAMQAILYIAPSSLHAAPVAQAKRLLRQLQWEQRGTEDAITRERRASAMLRFDDETDGNPAGALRRSNGDKATDSSGLGDGDADASAVEGAIEEERAADSNVWDTRPQAAREIVRISPLLGESTTSGGLLFLLHALRHLGIAAAVDRYPIVAEAELPGYILRRIADKAGVPENDAIRACLPLREAESTLPDELLRDAEFLRGCMPMGFERLAGSIASGDHLLRVWVLSVRRWCRRNGHLTVDEIVCRRGKVWLTRNDLDVTFPLKDADIRIRRIGLDIDPGWVPWLGLLGKVVRFHYRDGEGA